PGPAGAGDTDAHEARRHMGGLPWSAAGTSSRYRKRNASAATVGRLLRHPGIEDGLKTGQSPAGAAWTPYGPVLAQATPRETPDPRVRNPRNLVFLKYRVQNSGVVPLSP